MSPCLGVVVLTSQSDERLVRLARAGHERAFTVIVERYGPELRALARRLSPDGKAEDIVQQAFLSAFAALQSGAEVKHLRGWLYRIVRNVAARSRAPMCMPLDGGAASGESVEDVVEQRALAMSTLAELARLPTRQREAMVGTALDGRGRAEVASSMGVSEAAVRQLVHRARARLRTVVTAVTPWPLVRWFAGGPSGTGGTVSTAAGAVSSGGFFGVKFGVVLATGAIATGVAAVGIHRGRWVHGAAASVMAPAPHPHRERGHIRALELAADSPAVAAPAVVTRAPAGGDVTASRPSPAAPTTGPRRTDAATRRPATRRGGHIRTTDRSGRSDGAGTGTAGRRDDGGGGGSGGRADSGGGSGSGGDRVGGGSDGGGLAGGGDRGGGFDGGGSAGTSAGTDSGGGAGSSGGGDGGGGGLPDGGAQVASVTEDNTGFDHRGSGSDRQGSGFDQSGSSTGSDGSGH
jgi:RNA polymerase sigma factor (sigma-70 family)